MEIKTRYFLLVYEKTYLSMCKFLENSMLIYKGVVFLFFEYFWCFCFVIKGVLAFHLQNRMSTSCQIYLIYSKRDLNGSIFINFRHDIAGIMMDFIGTNTEVFWFLPEDVPTYTLSLTLWCGISRFTTRVWATSLIKIRVTLQGGKSLSL